jgi:hypothetical protein
MTSSFSLEASVYENQEMSVYEARVIQIVTSALKQGSDLYVSFCKLYFAGGDYVSRGWAPPSMVHRGTISLRISRVPAMDSRRMFRDDPRSWHKPVKNLGTLGTGDAGDLATRNATIGWEILVSSLGKFGVAKPGAILVRKGGFTKFS